jgi:hypothetical protein
LCRGKHFSASSEVGGSKMRPDFGTETGSKAIFDFDFLAQNIMFRITFGLQFASITDHFGLKPMRLSDELRVAKRLMSAIARTRFFLASLMATYCAVLFSMGGFEFCFSTETTSTPAVSRPSSFRADKTVFPALCGNSLASGKRLDSHSPTNHLRSHCATVLMYLLQHDGLRERHYDRRRQSTE